MNQDKIVDFLNGKLSENEKYTFLAELETDIEFRSEFEQLKHLKKIAERSKKVDILRLVHDRNIARLKGSKIRPFLQISTAAIAAGLAFIVYLGNAEFEYVQNIDVERGNATVKTSDFENGLTSLQNNQAEKAILYFEKTKSDTELNDYYRDAAKWYSAVAYAHLGQDQKAKTQLRQIDDSAGFKYKISWIEKMKLRMRLLF